ncbi:MAG: hypothetical protein QOE90_3721 [Thermoplasmata archaeon]|nr:hypothetical protein [Thermoplasmata archaeon]
MLTRKGALLAAALVGVVSLALLARSWVLALAALPLLAAFGAGLARALLPAPRPVARAEHAPERALAGDEADITVVVRGARTGLCEVAFQPHPFLELEKGAPVALRPLSPRDPARFDLRLKTAVRGRVPLGEAVARERSLFGVLSREGRAHVEREVVVLPRWEPLPEIRWLARRPRALPVGTSIARPGAGDEFYALRQYLPGDPIDSVNWKQTAKLGRPIVNEHELQAPADVLVALDARVSVHAGAGYHSTFEAAVRACVSISERALASRAKVGLLVLGARLAWIHPAHGRRQQEKIVEHLLSAFPGGDYDLADALLSLPPTVVPRAATVVLVTTGYGDARLPRAVETFAASGVRAVLVAVSPEACEMASGDLTPQGEAAARVLMAERTRWLDALRGAGADVVAWDPRQPLAIPLSLLEARR